MTPLLFVTLSLAGGLGAASRFCLDGVLKSSLAGRGSLPWSTIIINLLGSLALGLATGLAGSHLLSPAALLVLGTGFLGGFTTFSTASFETVRLLQDGKPLAACWNGIGVLVATTLLAGLGLWLGAQM